jgi:hypothetical protein
MFSLLLSKVDQGVKWLFATTKESWQAAGPSVNKPIDLHVTPTAQERSEAPGAANVIPFPTRRSCSVEGCEGTHHARGLCSRHYSQARRAKAA